MKSKKRWHIGLAVIIISVSLLLVLSITALAIYSSANIDFDADEALFLASRSENVTKFYYDGSGNFGLVPEEYVPVELSCVSGSEVRREWCAYSDISDRVKCAIISAEDRNFFEHKGINFKRTAGAVLGYIFKSDSYGGSTITQQVIKNISGDNSRTVKRKINEIIRAFHLEYRHSKEEIFEMYMNVIPLGEGVSGVALASEVYFDKEPRDLSTEEAALLAALVNAPTKYNPYRDYDRALEKRNVIISCMKECGFIDGEEYERAINSPITLAERKSTESLTMPWYIETICDEVVSDIVNKLGYSEKAARMYLMNGGLSVYTTIDPVAQEIIDAYFSDAKNFPEEISNGLNYSFVLCDSKSGDLRGISGGVGKKSGSRVINYALTPRAPASTLKPLALYAPLINDGRITWSTVFDDVPVLFNESESGEYTEYPKNSPSVYDGLIPIATALARSKNTVAVRLYDIIGAKGIAEHLSKSYGFNILRESVLGKSDMDRSPLALGQLTYGVPLRRLTEAYSAFASEGIMHSSRSYILCKDGYGKTVVEKPSDGKRIYSVECARVMNQMLMGVVNEGTAKRITLKEIVDVAGKTGTSGGNRDRLFVGYTPYLTGGIWMGYTDGREVGVYSQNQLKVWDDVMKLIHERVIDAKSEAESFSVAGLVRSAYCIDSGMLFCPKCIKDPRGERIAYGYFIKGSEPREECNRHVLVDYDIFLRGVAVNPTYSGFIEKISLLDIPERAFPKEITVTDAEYVYRRMPEGTLPGDSYDTPYFAYAIPDGEFVGRSKSKKQFNSSNIYS